MRSAVKKKKIPVFPVIVMIVLAMALLLLPALGKAISGPGTSRAGRTAGELLVCVDPGHGGDDQGASWNGRLEKDDNLAAALALRDALESLGVNVILTRTEDVTRSLEERVAAAEESGADYFISLHRNMFEGDANGVEVWVAQQCSEGSKTLADRLSAALVEVGVQRDRGVRRGSQDGNGDYYVLAHTTMPAVLVEMGFLQDEEDNRLLDGYMNDYAAAMAEAVLATWEETTA